MPTPGQPNLYNPTYSDLARDYCLVGATNEVLADYFGVSRRTIQNWIATHPDFADAVRKGRIVADAKVVRALFERATGFYGKVTRTYRGEKHTITTTICHPPDTPGLHVLAAQPPARLLAGQSRGTAGAGSHRRRPGGDGGALAG